MKCSVDELLTFFTQFYTKCGLSDVDAATMAGAIVHAESRGVSSHGLARARMYYERLLRGQLNTKTELTIESEGPATLAIDGNNAPGMVVGNKVMDLCVEKAKQSGICFATIHNSSHFGTGSYHVFRASEKGMIGFSICNTDACVVPYGGVKPMLGTNPITIGLPTKQYPNVMLDMATSVVSRGKVLYYEKVSKPLPDGWIVDKEGKPSNNPKDVFDGALVPFGLYKGSGLSIIIDMLCGVLAQGKHSRQLGSFHSSGLEDSNTAYQNVGFCMGVIDITRFIPFEQFVNGIDSIYAEFKQCPPAEGAEEVMLPGEIEAKQAQKCMEQGMEIPPVIAKEFHELAAQLGIESPFFKE